MKRYCASEGVRPPYRCCEASFLSSSWGAKQFFFCFHRWSRWNIFVGNMTTCKTSVFGLVWSVRKKQTSEVDHSVGIASYSSSHMETRPFREMGRGHCNGPIGPLSAILVVKSYSFGVKRIHLLCWCIGSNIEVFLSKNPECRPFLVKVWHFVTPPELVQLCIPISLVTYMPVCMYIILEFVDGFWKQARNVCVHWKIDDFLRPSRTSCSRSMRTSCWRQIHSWSLKDLWCKNQLATN